MKNLLSNVKCKLIILLVLFTCAITALCFGIINLKTAYADEEYKPLSSDAQQIKIQSYRLEDNSGYYASSDTRVPKKSHPLKKNLINLSVYTQSDITQSKIDKGQVNSYNAFGITGSNVAIQMDYNFDNAEDMKGEDGYSYSISSDTYQSVGEFKEIGVVGTGAMLFQKKYNPEDSWQWQTKDGETKNQLHTFNFTDFIKLEDYSHGEKYTLYTPSGEDLSRGVYIKITFAYELKYTYSRGYWNWYGAWKTKSETRYINMLETVEFYLVQNSGRVLFHNASKFDKVGEEGESGAISVNDFETLLSGDVTLNGFRLDTLGVDAYDITYRLNGGEENKASDGQYFFNQGRYDFNIKRKIGPSIPYTIFVDRREVNDAIVGYFGKGLFTPDSQRIYTTGEYPAYIAGKATWHLNATDGTVIPLVGELSEIVTIDDNKTKEEHITYITTEYGSDYKTEVLEGTIEKAGTYKAEFWGNPKYITEEEVSGDLYHFVFRFEIVDADTPAEPSINEAYLNGLIGFSDLQSKYYSVAVNTKGTGKAIFAFSDFGGAYDFAYGLEREKVTKTDDGYLYNNKKYSTQNAVLAAVDEGAKKLVTVRYFDSTDPESYQTADIADEKITELNLPRDVIVFANDNEQTYMRTEMPSLNGRKYRYVYPETGEIVEGTLYFSFLKIADFESSSITLIHKETKTVYDDIVYGQPVENQLVMKNAKSGVYIVRETNGFNNVSEYEAMYISPYDMTGSVNIGIFRGGSVEDKLFSKSNIVTETNLNGFILKSATNELDPYSIVKIMHNGETTIYAFEEVKDIYFTDGGVYDFVLADRLGNTVAFTLVITSPAGVADIHLELEQDDDSIITDYRVFVGQELELPVPNLTSELYVFDGWLYDDVLITDGKFTPTVGGKLYIWQQITQKYTYINFDSNGGAPVQKIKAEIGVPFNLPATTKQGWAFGGWEYGGTVHKDAYTPTTASPTFTAVWNYEQTNIELYDGNLYQSITARVGDKVLLPFPSRTGYTFFGWREELTDGTNKVYYGQITNLANVQSLKLDALWIRESSVEAESLNGGTGGRTMIHFVDGELLQNDSVQGVAGTSISLPKPTRAGFTFVGWVWRTTSVSGKIYNAETMTIPENTDGKIMLEALWSAKPAGGASAAGIMHTGAASGSVINGKTAGATVGAIGMFVALALLCYGIIKLFRTKRAASRYYAKTAAGKMGSEEEVITASEFAVPAKLGLRRNRIPFRLRFEFGIATVCVALGMSLIMSFTALFGNWTRFGGFKALADMSKDSKTQTVSTTKQYSSATADLGGNWQLDVQPTKTEVLDNIADTNTDFELDLTDEELFLYSLIMLDLYSLGYKNVFPAEAELSNGERILGFGYSNYEESYTSKFAGDSTVYYDAGFIALPRQTQISESEIKAGLKIYDSYNERNKDNSAQNNSGFEYAYLLLYTESYGPCHYVADGKYVVYSVENTSVKYSSVPAKESVYNPKYGSVYSYDEGRTVFDPDLGKTNSIKATSVNTMLDPAIAKGQYEQYITEQTANGFTVDTMNFVYISYESLDAYYLSNQDESLLGIDVQEFYEIEKTLGQNEYYTVDADGNLTKLEFPPKVEEKASWLDRLAGAVLSIGMICVGVIIVAAISVVSCGAASAAAPYIMGAFIGGGMELFMQTVVEGRKLEDVNWLRVGIAAVSGAVSAIPGLGWFGAGLVQGVTEAALTLADGGSLEDAFKSFAIGFGTGVVIHGVGKAVSKMKFCFVAGTPVLMAGGYTKAIESVHVGDMVKSYNPITGKVENRRVLQTFENETDELVTVTTTDGQKVVSTPGHKFFANNSWVSAEQLKAGDILVNVNGEKVIVEQVQHEILESPVKIYNFEVKDNHTYFVGDNAGIAVHNSRCAKISEYKHLDVNSGIDLQPNDIYSYKFKIKGDNGIDAWYVGKGKGDRLFVSQSQRVKQFKGEIVEVYVQKFTGETAAEQAFKQEAKWMNECAEKGSYMLNKIASPGFKKGQIEFAKDFNDFLFRNWSKKIL